MECASEDKEKQDGCVSSAFKSKLVYLLSHPNFEAYTPENCIDFLKMPSLNLLLLLSKRLKQNVEEWNEEFMELGGIDALLDLVDTLGSKRVTRLTDVQLLIECVGCIKSLLNSKMGVKYFVGHGDCLRRLAKGMLRLQFSIPKSSKHVSVAA